MKRIAREAARVKRNREDLSVQHLHYPGGRFARGCGGQSAREWSVISARWQAVSVALFVLSYQSQLLARCSRRQQESAHSENRRSLVGAGYGDRTRDLNFGKVACYRYTKPACIPLTRWIIADRWKKVKCFASFFTPAYALRLWYHNHSREKVGKHRFYAIHHGQI